MLISEFQIEFSYHIFLIYDSDVDLPGNEWTETNSNQGFARRASSVNFGTLFQFGYAQVQVFKNDYLPNKDDERVIKVPFYSPSGKVIIEGPEENAKNSVIIEPGHYLLTAAQQAEYDEESLLIRLFFSKVETPATKTEIIIKDEQLNPPRELLETSEIATF
jgi:hypothetical protein